MSKPETKIAEVVPKAGEVALPFSEACTCLGALLLNATKEGVTGPEFILWTQISRGIQRLEDDLQQAQDDLLQAMDTLSEVNSLTEALVNPKAPAAVVVPGTGPTKKV